MTEFVSTASTARTAGFNFSLNPSLDELTVRELATGDFVSRGESLLVVGGSGTGKSTIAGDVIDAVTARGGSTRMLGCWGAHRDFDFGLMHAPSFYIGSDGRSGLRSELLEVDLLVFDDAHHGFAASPMGLLALIGHRCALGKSNILLATTAGWDEVKNGGTRRDVRFRDARLIGWMIENDLSPRWAELVFRMEYFKMTEVFANLGIARDPVDLSEITAYHGHPWLDKPMGVWHGLYTGENSFRYRGRYAI